MPAVSLLQAWTTPTETCSQSVTPCLTARGPRLLVARWRNTLQTITAVCFQSARYGQLQLKVSFNKPRVSSAVRENIHDDKFSDHRFSTGQNKPRNVVFLSREERHYVRTWTGRITACRCDARPPSRSIHCITFTAGGIKDHYFPLILTPSVGLLVIRRSAFQDCYEIRHVELRERKSGSKIPTDVSCICAAAPGDRTARPLYKTVSQQTGTART
jgi:hypothetical protein